MVERARGPGESGAARNQALFDTPVSAAQLRAEAQTPYDEGMQALRREIVDVHGADRLVLDLGCGPGAFLTTPGTSFRRAVGLDFSREMLKAARRAGVSRDARLVAGDAQHLPVRSGILDLVFSFRPCITSRTSVWRSAKCRGCSRKGASPHSSSGIGSA